MFSKKAFLWGAVFGLIAPFAGLFIGLQISTILADILLFPVIFLSSATQTPFGVWGGWMMLLALAFSIVVWALVFAVIAWAWRAFVKN